MSAADDERGGEQHPGTRAARCTKGAHQGRAGQVGHAVGEGLQGEGGGQRGGPLAGQQGGPAGGGQGTELGQRCPDEHSGDDVRNGAGEQQRHGSGMCAQRAGKHPRLPEPVDKAPDLGPGDSETAGDETAAAYDPVRACTSQTMPIPVMAMPRRPTAAGRKKAAASELRSRVR
ncbi:hypothetical protein [Streptomyces sp. NPDC127033]|uniref:hypothetical protein n=1 Tax=Streptomyces sp. NPDC127033 TaxID=3347110 RepID=UPI00365EB91F